MSFKSHLEITPEEEKTEQDNFLALLLIQIKKVEFFFSENLSYYKTRIEKIREQLNYIKKNKQFKNFKDNLEVAIKELNKELTLMMGYIELNLKAKFKIVKKFKKFTKYSKFKSDFSVIDNYIENSQLKESVKLLGEIQSELERIFYANYFEKYSFHCGKALKDYASPIYFTQEQSFYFGFFCGILVILLILCILIMKYFKIDMDDDAEFKTIFPMFRGYFILCMYFWLLGLNVYAWNKAHINYKLCFAFKNHYSDVISIFKRAAVFSTVNVLTILCYMILRTKIPILNDLFSFIPLELTPFICWVILVIYLFFPFNYFNYQGRVYMLNIFIESCASIFIKCEFKHVWLTDQLTSMIGPLRDIEYTLCYYAHYGNTFEDKKAMCSTKREIILLIAVLPHILRTLQCFRSIYDSKKVFPQILNAGKYGMAILVAVTSFFASNYLLFDNVWWLFALISTIYSYIWDLKMDFGFLQHGDNYPLRTKLSYKNKFFYYFCLVTNLFLRFMWVLSVSPEVVYTFIRPEFFLLMIYSMEVLRRRYVEFYSC